MRVKLIVTGELEKAALHRSLSRWFPQTGDGQPIEFVRPSMFQGPTCNVMDDGAAPKQVSELVRTFTDGLVAEALFGSDPRAKPPDLVVGVDDLELANLHQPDIVSRCIRHGVENYFVRHPVGSGSEERYRQMLREKCSFHLLVPMPEAYFFGERAALERAGVAERVHARLCCEDLEALATDDPTFEARPEHPGDLRHPKRYLSHLLLRSGRAGPRPYRETRDGARALESLEWPTLSDNPKHLAFARALFEDLAFAFNVPNPLGDGALAPSTHALDRRANVLRNI